jgi:hypothetical protein
MGKDMKGNITPGDRIGEITTINTFKKIMIDLLKGYPEYKYFGIFETYFKENTAHVIEILKKDKLIEVITPKRKEEPIHYRLSTKGIDFAISMINLEHSEKMTGLTNKIVFLTILLTITSLAQLILIWFQIHMLA